MVTGGAKGIGRAIVEKFIESPDNSVIVIDKEKTEFIDSLLKGEGERFYYFKHDIADRSGLASVLGKIKDMHKINGIVNNAAEIYFENWKDFKMETWDRTMDVNLSAPLQIVHSLTNSLEKNASIVNIASTDGFYAAFDSIAYAVSKAALMSLTKSLAAVLGDKKVRVNAIAPGWVETEMTKDTMPAATTEINPLHRNAKAKEIADVVWYLLSEKSSFINGQTIVVDGGLTTIDYTIFREFNK